MQCKSMFPEFIPFKQLEINIIYSWKSSYQYFISISIFLFISCAYWWRRLSSIKRNPTNSCTVNTFWIYFIRDNGWWGGVEKCTGLGEKRIRVEHTGQQVNTSKSNWQMYKNHWRGWRRMCCITRGKRNWLMD